MLFHSPPPSPPVSPVVPAASGQTVGTPPAGPHAVILVVDDSSMIRNAVTRLLTAHHYEVRQAENGRLGLAAWEQGRAAIHLVLSDIFMPEMDGFTMAQAIRRQSATVPVLLMSSKLDDNSRWIAEEAGFRLLPKPFKDELLLALVHRMLRLSRGTL